MKGITVKELLELCKKQVELGNGDKTVMLSGDDEGNSFHTLYYQFETDIEVLESFNESGAFSEEVDLNDIVLLG